MLKLMIKADILKRKAMKFFTDNSGQGALEQAITILVAVVLGALMLAGLYALLGDTVLPTLTKKIKDMFNYSN